MPHSVHLRLHEEQYSEDKVAEWFDQFIEEYDDVERGRSRIEKSVDPAIAISGATLAVASIQTLIQIYSHLKDKPEVHYINLFSPDSERYPVQIYSEALGSIENPGQYDIYGVDDEVTLVVCDNMDELRKVQSDVDPDGLVENLDSTAPDSDSKEPEKESGNE
jgi:hypothetical protein